MRFGIVSDYIRTHRPLKLCYDYALDQASDITQGIAMNTPRQPTPAADISPHVKLRSYEGPQVGA